MCHKTAHINKLKSHEVKRAIEITPGYINPIHLNEPYIKTLNQIILYNNTVLISTFVYIPLYVRKEALSVFSVAEM